MLQTIILSNATLIRNSMVPTQKQTQINRAEESLQKEIHTYIRINLTTKEPGTYNVENIASSINSVGKNCTVTCRSITLDYFPHHRKLKLRNKYIFERPETT